MPLLLALCCFNRAALALLLSGLRSLRKAYWSLGGSSARLSRLSSLFVVRVDPVWFRLARRALLPLPNAPAGG